MRTITTTHVRPGPWPATLVCLCLIVSGSACRAQSPAAPSGISSITFTQQSPAAGSTIIVSEGTPPGAFITRGSGQIAVGLAIRSALEVPWAQLNVYLLSGDGYCGQNLPDSPTWRPFVAGQTATYTVTGFQVYRLPCDVTGIRAMLHLRNSGLLIPPTPGETIADATFSVTYQLRR